jgi:hypothetical protein
MEGFATAAVLGVTRSGCPSSWADTREVDFDVLTVDGLDAATTVFFLGAGFTALTPSFTACAHTAGAATESSEAAINPHKTSLETTFTKRLISTCWLSLGHKKKTSNIKNLRNIFQAAH